MTFLSANKQHKSSKDMHIMHHQIHSKLRQISKIHTHTHTHYIRLIHTASRLSIAGRSYYRWGAQLC